MPSFGTLKADTLTHSTAGSLDTNYVVNGSAKQWVNYDAVDQAIKGSLNQSSLTDHGTGDFSSYYTNVIAASEDKCILALVYNTINEGSSVASGSARGGAMADQAGDTSQSTSRVNFHTYYGSTGSSDGAYYDYDGSYCVTLGDLA